MRKKMEKEEEKIMEDREQLMRRKRRKLEIETD